MDSIQIVGEVISAIGVLVSLIQIFTDREDKILYSVNIDQLGYCDVIQYLTRRHSLKLLAEQHAKKRTKTRYVNIALFACFVGLLWLSIWVYNVPSVKETIDSSPSALNLYTTWLLLLELFVLLVFPLLLANVSSWIDLFKKLFSWLLKTIGKIKVIKESIKERYPIHISQVMDIASNFDTYLLYDADSHNTDGVIGAKKINKNDSICKVIESDLNENGATCEMIKTDPSENDTDKFEQAQDDTCKSAQTEKKTAVVFIYSRYGKASYDKTKEARTKYKDVYDLGSVCGEMRELEIVAHQLLYLKENNCLKLP